MKWERYIKNAEREAKKQRIGKASFLEFLKYAKPLFERDLPVIVDSHHFAALVGFQHQYICNMAYGTERFYRSFHICKSNGDLRKIDEPLPDLKQVQRWILDEILSKIEISPYAKAYVKGKSTKDNARFHRAQRVVVSLDIKNFFPSIRLRDVESVFEETGFTKSVSSFLANLCCLQMSLPQGAPTSPYISNIRMIEIDRLLGSYCMRNGWRYTRYADDMTFSGDINVNSLIHYASNVVYENGFMLNASKTRVARSNARQEVTGIVVNQYMQAPRYIRKHLRQQVHYIKRFGLNSHLNHIGETRRNYAQHLLGMANYASYINPKDKELKDIVMFLVALIHEIREDRHQ